MLTDEDKQWVREQLDLQAAAYREHMERIETKLLTAFQGWASPQEARQRTHTAALRALDLEVEYLDNRVKAH